VSATIGLCGLMPSPGARLTLSAQAQHLRPGVEQIPPRPGKGVIEIFARICVQAAARGAVNGPPRPELSDRLRELVKAPAHLIGQASVSSYMPTSTAGRRVDSAPDRGALCRQVEAYHHACGDRGHFGLARSWTHERAATAVLTQAGRMRGSGREFVIAGSHTPAVLYLVEQPFGPAKTFSQP
jgi:hypothetical protein